MQRCNVVSCNVATLYHHLRSLLTLKKVSFDVCSRVFFTKDLLRVLLVVHVHSRVSFAAHEVSYIVDPFSRTVVLCYYLISMPMAGKRGRASREFLFGFIFFAL
jgi:hypothetical protein